MPTFKVSLCAVKFYDFWPMESCIHHYSVIQNSVTTLKSPVCLAVQCPLFPSLLVPGNHSFIYCFYSFDFSRLSNQWSHLLSSLFRTGFFHLPIYILVSSMSFHFLITYSLPLPNSIPLYGCTSVCSFIYWKKSW